MAQGTGPSASVIESYASEVRFGVVMYGGVSLAIYINGVANELYELCCATPKPRDAARPAPASSRDVYRKLSWLRQDEGLCAAYLAHANGVGPDPFADGDPAGPRERVRFVVDVIAGTSAGGINGVFLAKALANGEAFAPLKRLWVQEGDMASLLNDGRSYEGIEFAKTDAPPKSLLNSDRMYLKLLQAMEAMTPALPSMGGGESALSDELDLYVTTTDIRGSVVPLRLFDKVVYEKRHRQVYHFQYAGAGGRSLRNDFTATNAPFLAFAARCTSSFPFAFEPMTLDDAQRLARLRPGGGGIDFSPWRRFFTGLSSDDMSDGRWRTRAFGDGGYLDNKPFSYVVEALSWRLGALPMERKLLYVEPAPTHPERERQAFDDKPDAIENAIGALTSIPQYETIREDLEAVLKRNQRIERVERIVRKVEADVERVDEEPFARVLVDKQGAVPDWSTLDLGDMVAYYGVAFLPYRRLRLTTVSDDLADRMCERWGVDRKSSLRYAMRALVRAWREGNYFEHRRDATPTQTASINAFLEVFDLKYRLRRIGFLLRKTHELVHLVRRLDAIDAGRQTASESEAPLLRRLRGLVPAGTALDAKALLQTLLRLRDGLAQAMSQARAAVWPSEAARTGTATADERALLEKILRLLIGEPLDPPLRALEASDGSHVPLAQGQLPPASAQRTLQENVYERARVLFAAARGERRTKIQDRLEADIEVLRQQCLPYTRYAPAQEGALRVRDMLGQPQLVVVAAPSADNPARQKVAVQVADVSEPYGGAELNTVQGRAVRCLLAEYYLRFDEYDQVSFPLYYDTGTGEPATVEVLRVSPEDAPGLVDESADLRRKLAGTALFNFGGFLDARWRRNDIMWGRLDGCERLLAALLPDADQTALREALRAEAQRAILREEMSPEGYAELVERFTQALQAEGRPTLQQAFGALWAKLGATDDERHTRTAMALQAVLGDTGLLDWFKAHYEVQRDVDTAQALDSASRAITITGRILEQVEKQQRGGGSRMVWVTRAGRAFQALLALSTPGSMLAAVTRHWLAALYLFEVLLFGAAVLFAAPATRDVAFSALGLTVALHLATLVTGDLLQQRSTRIKALAFVLAVTALVLAALGVSGLARLGPRAMLCGSDAVPSLIGALAPVCRR